MRVSADVDERTLREIYLPAFERVVTQAAAVDRHVRVQQGQRHVRVREPRGCSPRCCATSGASTALVVSDWGAVHDRVPALAAGLDLEMPATGAAHRRGGRRRGPRRRARRGRARPAVRRVLTLVAPRPAGAAEPGHVRRRRAPRARPRGRGRGRRAAARTTPSTARPLAPLRPGAAGVAVVGEFARTPRYQGAGSSQVNPTRLDDAAGRAARATGADVPFAAGFTHRRARPDRRRRRALLAEAVEVGARRRRPSSLFLGLPACRRVRGLRPARTSDLPANQVALLARGRRGQPARRRRARQRLGGHRRRLAATTPRRSSRRGSAARPAAAPSPTCCSASAPRRAGSPRRSRSARGHPVVRELPRRARRTSATARASWSATAGTTPRAMDVAYPFGHGLSYTTFALRRTSRDRRATAPTSTVRASPSPTPAPSPGPRSSRSTSATPRPSVAAPDARAQGVRQGHARSRASRARCRSPSAHATCRTGTPGLHRWVVEGGEFVGRGRRLVPRPARVGVARRRGRAALGRRSRRSSTIERVVRAPGRRSARSQAALVPPADMRLRSTRRCRR